MYLFLVSKHTYTCFLPLPYVLVLETSMPPSNLKCTGNNLVTTYQVGNSTATRIVGAAPSYAVIH